MRDPLAEIVARNQQEEGFLAAIEATIRDPTLFLLLVLVGLGVLFFLVHSADWRRRITNSCYVIAALAAVVLAWLFVDEGGKDFMRYMTTHHDDTYRMWLVVGVLAGLLGYRLKKQKREDS